MTEPQFSAPQEEQPPAPQQNGSQALSRGVTLVVTNLGKLVGFALAINEAFIRHNARNSIVMTAVVFVVGSQVLENIALKAIDRMFGGSQQ